MAAQTFLDIHLRQEERLAVLQIEERQRDDTGIRIGFRLFTSFGYNTP